VKQKTGRTYIPALMGEYVSEDELRSWAQEFFLNAVWNAAPAPLYALRDEIFPIYRDAFNFSKRHKHSNNEAMKLAIQAFTHVIVTDQIDGGLKLGAEYQTIRASAPRWYEGSERLLDWSKRFNLVGRRVEVDEAADPKRVKSARMDSMWPLVAALETVLMWHSCARVVQTPAGLPMWRPRPFKGPKEPEVLKPIYLKTLLHDPRASISSELLEKLDPDGPPARNPTEVDTPGWYLELEEEASFRKRISKDFERWLSGYIANRHESAKASGLLKGPGKRDLARFAWAAQYQVKGTHASALAEQYGVSNEAVVDGINWVLDLIRLVPRAGRRGRKRLGHPTTENHLDPS
jgi:hypothetical protein